MVYGGSTVSSLTNGMIPICYESCQELFQKCFGIIDTDDTAVVIDTYGKSAAFGVGECTDCLEILVFPALLPFRVLTLHWSHEKWNARIVDNTYLRNRQDTRRIIDTGISAWAMQGSFNP